MKTHNFSLALISALFAIAFQSAGAQTPSAAASTSPVAPADNSKANKMDHTNTNATADGQKDNANDRTITQSIRKNVMADKSLSTYAHNVKIVSVNGSVTLNGVVRSDQEKASVEAKAVAVVGPSHVVNDLKVAPKS
jgi:hyperosmotically inducible periplasmic protein